MHNAITAALTAELLPATIVKECIRIDQLGKDSLHTNNEIRELRQKLAPTFVKAMQEADRLIFIEDAEQEPALTILMEIGTAFRSDSSTWDKAMFAAGAETGNPYEPGTESSRVMAFGFIAGLLFARENNNERKAQEKPEKDAVISNLEAHNTEPDENGWFDATQVKPFVTEEDICESNHVLALTADKRILLVNFYSGDWDDGDWANPPGFGLELGSYQRGEITHWMPLPAYDPSEPWVGTNKSHYDEDAPQIRFFHEQQVIAKAEEEKEIADAI